MSSAYTCIMDPVWVPFPEASMGSIVQAQVILTVKEKNYFKPLTTADRNSFHVFAEIQLGTKSLALVLQHVFYHLRLIDMKEHSKHLT